MIDLKAARADPDRYRAALARKGAAEAFDELLAADERWRALVPRVDELRARTKLRGKPSPEQLEELRGVKEELQQVEASLAGAERDRDRLALRVPNLPADDVPDGATEDDVRELRRVGEPPELADPKEHLELGRFDMDRAARMSGARFGYWIGDTARLALALYRYALDRLAAQGFVTVLPPVLVRAEALVGTGAFPTDEQNVYELAGDDLFLAGTAEIPLAGLHAGEIIDRDELPLRYVAFSPCFRREAGAAGRDTRGMIRVHQFNKVEQFALTLPEASWDEHERLLANTEELVRDLGLPYRVVVLPAGDMSAASAKTYDVEIWFPSQGRYRETASISNTTDFQARRLGIRYRDGKALEPVHTLNGTAVVDRMALAILENFQDGDGSVTVPGPLVALGAPRRIGGEPASTGD
ncbi:MAG TPA: serine--tRNA ligase [Gaiellaceae bacterium]|nr:serine--tRNA ligase [Gaiellaceae bacterium]